MMREKREGGERERARERGPIMITIDDQSSLHYRMANVKIAAPDVVVFLSCSCGTR
jgi:hypothetical protein